MINKDLKLSRVLEICDNIGSSLYKDNEEQFNLDIDSIKIIRYIPIAQKYVIVLNKIYQYDNSGIEVEDNIIAQETDKLWTMLEYYTNIDCSDDSLKTFENYDKIMLYLYDIITEGIGSDVKNLLKLIDKANNMNMIMDVSNKLVNFSNSKPEDIEAITQSLKKFMNENKDDIQLLEKIVEFNNPKIEEIFTGNQKIVNSVI